MGRPEDGKTGGWEKSESEQEDGDEWIKVTTEITCKESHWAMEKISHFSQLNVYMAAAESAMLIQRLIREFPRDERYCLSSQIRRSSRSVAANIAEAWGKRRYAAAFVSKLNDSESEAYETQSWIDFALRCGYIDPVKAQDISSRYSRIIGQLIVMMNQPEKWTLPQPSLDDRKTEQRRAGFNDSGTGPAHPV